MRKYKGQPGSDVELKWLDSSVNEGAVPLAGSIYNITTVAQGTGPSQRIGRKIVIKSILWKGYGLKPTISNAADALAGESVTLRLAIIQDKQANGAFPTIGEIWDASSGGGVGVNAFNNLFNRDRFITLIDKRMFLNSGGLGSDGTDWAGAEEQKNFYYKKRVNMPIEYSSTTGAITEVRSNNIFVVLIASNDQLAQVASGVRIRYTDC